MLDDGVSHAPHEIFVRVASVARPDDDQVSAFVSRKFHQLRPWRSGHHHSSCGKSVALQRSYSPGCEFVGFTSKRSLDLVAHRKSPCGKTDAFQGEGRNDGDDDHDRTDLFR